MSLTKVKAGAGVFGVQFQNFPLSLTYVLAIRGTLNQSVRKKRFDKWGTLQGMLCWEQLKE